REAIANGRRIGPRVFIAGDPFDGVRIREAGGVSIGSEPQLDAALARATLLGVDFLTLRGRLGSRLESHLVDYAHGHGLRMTTPGTAPWRTRETRRRASRRLSNRTAIRSKRSCLPAGVSSLVQMRRHSWTCRTDSACTWSSSNWSLQG